MAFPDQVKWTPEERREQALKAYELSLQGHLDTAISQQLGLSLATTQRRLRWAREQAWSGYQKRLGALTVEAITKFALIRDQALSTWAQQGGSPSPSSLNLDHSESVTTVEELGPPDLDGNRQLRTVRRESTVQSTPRPRPDPRLLAEARQAQAELNKLLGLNQPTKTESKIEQSLPDLATLLQEIPPANEDPSQ